ncbi:hypothetical protein AB3Z07_21395 [Metabacillus halosaccharovorans]|uniref:hypothetical protein n=1 Tax=Metabacillus halosaccharovorans TaxID=930124 RepID=UPI0034CD2A80
MAKHQLFHESVQGELVPFWYVIQFDKDEIDWDKNIIYTPVKLPVEYKNRDEFERYKLSLPIKVSDLVFNSSDTTKIGINLRKLKKNINNHGLSYNSFQQFVFLCSDTRELIKFLPNSERRLLYLERKGR